MSNCINSGIMKIFILTQFNSFSLNRHLARTYNFGNGVNFGDGFVEVLAATQTSGEAGKKWFQGTVDSVRQFVWVFEDAKAKDVEHVACIDIFEKIDGEKREGEEVGGRGCQSQGCGACIDIF